MHCFDCNHELERGAKFCPNCGRDLRPSGRRGAEPSRARVTFPIEEAVAGYDAILAELKRKARRRGAIALLVYLLAMLVIVPMALAAPSEGHAMAAFVGGFWGLVIALAFFLRRSYLTEIEYYALPGSRNGQGQHQCIFCGNRGIYRNVGYKQSGLKHRCSKCGKLFFVGPEN